MNCLNFGITGEVMSKKHKKLMSCLNFGITGEVMSKKHKKWTVDECVDANGFYTIRIADGTGNGD
jgi:hypothetical protein